MKIRILAGALSLFMMTPALAATVIEMQNDGEKSTVLTNGKQARMNMPGAEYVIIDYRKQQMNLINPKQQQVMLFDARDMPAADKSATLKTSVNAIGAGPMIAGYKTQKYKYTANGKSCGMIYGSKAALNVEGMNALFQAIKIMVQQQQTALGGFTGFIDDCTLADMQVVNHIKTIGVPMRTERNGTVDSEIKSIKVNVTLPANTFIIPASYKTATIQDVMNTSSQDMAKARQQMQQQQPKMQEMMRQMRESGKMTPEMMQQMQRAQEMMKQYQQ